MLEGSSAQFLCIVETLNDTNRRTLITQVPAADSEVEILDVFAELFMAAQEIICGESQLLRVRIAVRVKLFILVDTFKGIHVTFSPQANFHGQCCLTMEIHDLPGNKLSLYLFIVL